VPLGLSRMSIPGQRARVRHVPCGSRAGLSGLPGRTGHGAVGTKHAAVTGQGLERLAAARAYKKETAGIGRHPLGRRVPASGAFEYGYGLHPSDRGIAERHLPAPSLALSRRAARSIAACVRIAQSLHPRRHQLIFSTGEPCAQKSNMWSMRSSSRSGC